MAKSKSEINKDYQAKLRNKIHDLGYKKVNLLLSPEEINGLNKMEKGEYKDQHVKAIKRLLALVASKYK